MEQTLNQPQTLSIKHLAKNYSKRWVVKDVSFSMESGQIVRFTGTKWCRENHQLLYGGWIWCGWTKGKFILMT